MASVGEPRWIDDATFDINAHVVELTEPTWAVCVESFERLRDSVLSKPLDRSRPLWQIAVVPRLQDGRVGVIGRVHHAMADGTAALIVASLLLDTTGLTWRNHPLGPRAMLLACGDGSQTRSRTGSS